MSTFRAVLLAGHAHWGKSRTLRALTGGRLRKKATFGRREYFIRRMSNDDVPDGFVRLINALVPAKTPSLLAAFCPTFSDPEAQAESILGSLTRKKYELYFFVLLHSYDGNRQISADELRILGKHGVVQVFRDYRAEARDRADALSEFLTRGIPD